MLVDPKAFSLFIDYFPPADSFPLSVTPEDIHDFEKHNHVLPLDLVQQCIVRFEKEPDEEELTEYIPCFRLPSKSYLALVWWKGALLEYNYELATYTPQGKQIDRVVVAGTQTEADKLIQKVATFQDANTIISATGESDFSGNLFDAAESRSMLITIEDDGSIIT